MKIAAVFLKPNLYARAKNGIDAATNPMMISFDGVACFVILSNDLKSRVITAW